VLSKPFAGFTFFPGHLTNNRIQKLLTHLFGHSYTSLGNHAGKRDDQAFRPAKGIHGTSGFDVGLYFFILFSLSTPPSEGGGELGFYLLTPGACDMPKVLPSHQTPPSLQFQPVARFSLSKMPFPTHLKLSTDQTHDTLSAPAPQRACDPEKRDAGAWAHCGP